MCNKGLQVADSKKHEWEIQADVRKINVDKTKESANGESNR